MTIFRTETIEKTHYLLEENNELNKVVHARGDGRDNYMVIWGGQPMMQLSATEAEKLHELLGQALRRKILKPGE